MVYGRYNELVFMGVLFWYINQQISLGGPIHSMGEKLKKKGGSKWKDGLRLTWTSAKNGSPFNQTRTARAYPPVMTNSLLLNMAQSK